MRFYDSMDAPTWYMNFTNYGHADIMTPDAAFLSGIVMCPMCKGDGCDVMAY